MATTAKKTNKKGQVFYEIRAHVSRNRPMLSAKGGEDNGINET